MGNWQNIAAARRAWSGGANRGPASRRAALFLATALLCASALPAAARGLLRDAETEYALQVLALPVMTTAALPGAIPVLIVNDMSLNAFVIDGGAVFLHAGLFLRLKTAEEVQAVISHELGHITNSHITRRGLNAENAKLASSLGLALGVAAGALSGNAAAGFGIAAGSAGSARGVFLSHTREEESAADRSGMRYLARAGIDPDAMADVLKIFEDQDDLNSGRRDPYASTHPLSRDRIRAVEAYAEVLGPQNADHAAARYWFARAQAKLAAYLTPPADTFRRWPAGDDSDAARIARAVAYHKMGRADAAFAESGKLIAARPDDAFAHELEGWIALESNRIDRAVAAYGEAARLRPKETQILAGYGRALLAVNRKDSDQQALDVLSRAYARDRDDPSILRDLAAANARLGRSGEASLYTAERYNQLGDMTSAGIHASRALSTLPVGSPGYRRAQDIMDAAQAAAKKRR